MEQAANKIFATPKTHEMTRNKSIESPLDDETRHEYWCDQSLSFICVCSWPVDGGKTVTLPIVRPISIPFLEETTIREAYF